MLTSGAFEDRKTSQGRLISLRIALIACFGLLAVAFWSLQVVQHTKYEELAANNFTRAIPLRAPRGVLFDRTGRVLVENQYSFTITIVREQTRNLDATIRRLAEVTGVPEPQIRDIVKRRLREPVFRPITVIEHASFAQVAAVTARHLEMPEIKVQQVPTRTYPTGMAAHLFGYVGEITEAQLTALSSAQPNLQPGSVIGQAGLEKVYNDRLMGVDGNRLFSVNSVGREIDEVRKEEPVDGQRMQLTIDYDLQKALEDAFKTAGFAGAAVVLNPNDGEVLALTSLPSYDPNDFANGLDGATWSRLITDPKKPMTNRLIQGTYAPGSTFKILMATAALSEGIITPDYKVFCPGSFTYYGHTFRCDKKEGHGSLDLRHAIEQSCDVYFYKLASLMKVDTIHEYAVRLGLVGKTGIDLPGEIEGLVPSTEWKMRTKHEPWYPGETISVGIGQGQVSVTPIALATMIASVANGGTVVTPHVVRATDEGRGWVPLPVPAPRSVFPLRPDVLEPVRDGLWLAVNGAGTAGRARIEGRDVVGKTGTAQVISSEGAKAAAKLGLDHRDNSWFVFYAPKDKPEIAGVIFVEHGGWGATAATPIARYVLETYFAKQDKRPLPGVKLGGDGVLTVVPGGQTPPPTLPTPLRQVADRAGTMAGKTP
jgi:penicillin-binding protein 2